MTWFDPFADALGCETEIDPACDYAMRPHAGGDRIRREIGKVKLLLDIQRQLAAGPFEFSRHAFRRAVERNISEREIREAGAKAEVIEDYPDDKYSPGGLCLGFTTAGPPLHFQVSYAIEVTGRLPMTPLRARRPGKPRSTGSCTRCTG